MVRSDSAGATHAFAKACRARNVWFSFGFPVDARIQAIVDQVPELCWAAAIETDGGIRDGAWVADVTGMLKRIEHRGVTFRRFPRRELRLWGAIDAAVTIVTVHLHRGVTPGKQPSVVPTSRRRRC